MRLARFCTSSTVYQISPLGAQTLYTHVPFVSYRLDRVYIYVHASFKRFHSYRSRARKCEFRAIDIARSTRARRCLVCMYYCRRVENNDERVLLLFYIVFGL